METNGPELSDCRECRNLYWDFDAGRFTCEMAKEMKIEDLHRVPEWCPLYDMANANRYQQMISCQNR